MATKKELGQEIAGLKRELRGVTESRHRLRLENDRFRRDERLRDEHNMREAQRKREEQQHKERREHLDHLGAGRLPLKGAESWAFVHEPGKAPAIEVTVPLDDEELRVLQEHLRPKPKPAAKPIDVFGPLFSKRSQTLWDDYFRGLRPIPFRI